VVHVGNKQILISVSVEVRSIHSHARSWPPTLAKTDACLQGNLIPFPLAIHSRTAIHEEEILHRVIGHKQIHPAIIVDIGGDHPEPLA
jgi:hypothetical protein